MSEIKLYKQLPKGKDVFHAATPVVIRVVVLLVFATGVLAAIWLINNKLNLGWIILSIVAAGTAVIFSLVAVNAFKIESWVSFSMSTGGVYLPASVSGEFVFVPWRYIGDIKTGLFGLNKRGLRIEILESAMDAPIANVVDHAGNESAAWVQVKSDLLNREKLIAKAKSLRMHSQGA
jgi:hypothetical protein